MIARFFIFHILYIHACGGKWLNQKEEMKNTVGVNDKTETSEQSLLSYKNRKFPAKPFVKGSEKGHGFVCLFLKKLSELQLKRLCARS